MPNWCSTSVLFKGDRTKELHDDMEQSMKIPAGGDVWIGRLFLHKGMSEQDVLDNIRCRGFISDFSMEEKYFKLQMEDAWAPQFEAYEKIAELYGLEYELVAEEPGMGVYVITENAEYFIDKYFLEVEEAESTDKVFLKLQELSELRYFDDFSYIQSALKSVGCEVHTTEDVRKLMESTVTKHGDLYWTFEEFVPINPKAEIEAHKNFLKQLRKEEVR